MDPRTLALCALALGISTSTSAAQTAQTTRASVDSAGAQANGSSVAAAISADGRFVAFESTATNLVPGDTNALRDVFVHDRETGETTRASEAFGGGDADGLNLGPALSADGRYVAFYGNSTNLVAGGSNGGLFVRDRATGITVLASVSSFGAQSWGQNASFSTDGSIVAFESGAANLVSNDFNNAWDCFVHDFATGQTTRVSVRSNGSEVHEGGRWPSISGDGRYVAFESMDPTFVNGDTNQVADIFVHDRLTGETQRVSVNSAGNQAEDWSYRASISADGRFVAFESNANNLNIYDSNETWDVFVHDRLTGQTRAASREHGGNGDTANGTSSFPSISPDGRFVAFESAASDLVAGDTNGTTDVFVHDLVTGQTARASVGACGGEVHGASRLSALAAGGLFAAFESLANDLVPDDTLPGSDVFVRQPEAGLPFCFGDGTGAPCACLNEGAPDSGCGNSAGAGARLATQGHSCLAHDTLAFLASELPAGQPALLLAGLNALNGGEGIHFGDGLRCVGGAVQRVATVTADAGGDASFGPGLAGPAGWVPGDLRRFQVWYRDPAGPCGLGFNTTNGAAVFFSP